MITQVKQIKHDTDPQYFIHPKKFVLWLLMVASVMLFASFTSAYIVRQGEGNWLIFDLPVLFTVDTVIIALSSVSMQWAYFAAKKDELVQVKIATFITLLLGISFAVGQWYGYQDLISRKLYLAGGNPSQSFLYVISFVHLLHIVSGIIFLVVILVKSFRFKVHKKNMLSINLCTTYWHFLGLLWIYLYFFFQLSR